MKALDRDPLVNAANICGILKGADFLPDVVTLPELWTGVHTPGCDDRFFDACEDALLMVSDLCSEFGIYAVAGSVPWRLDGGVVNRSWIINDLGESFAHYDKVHLSSADGERGLFVCGDRPTLFDIGGVTCSAVMYYDTCFPEFMRCLSLGGAKIIFVSANLKNDDQKYIWDIMLRSAAISNQIFVVACNSVGAVSESSYSGGSIILSPCGSLLAEGASEEMVVSAELDTSTVDRSRQNTLFYHDRHPALYSLLSI